MITCCKGCTDRHVGCHADCEQYIAEKEESEAFKAAVRKAKGPDLEVTMLEMSRGKRRKSVRH